MRSLQTSILPTSYRSAGCIIVRPVQRRSAGEIAGIGAAGLDAMSEKQTGSLRRFRTPSVRKRSIFHEFWLFRPSKAARTDGTGTASHSCRRHRAEPPTDERSFSKRYLLANEITHECHDRTNRIEGDCIDSDLVCGFLDRRVRRFYFWHVK